MIDNIDLLDLSQSYSYTDYLQWRFKERVELIKGKVFKMSPAPRRVHQEISRYLVRQLDAFFYDDPCKLYFAPFDVRLPRANDEEVLTVVQPDICVICDQYKLDEKGCNGAPDLIVEILSPSTAKTDVQDKFDLYEESGVKEYWIVHVDEKILELFYLNGGRYQLERMYTQEDTFHSVVFDKLQIDLKAIFTDGLADR